MLPEFLKANIVDNRFAETTDPRSRRTVPEALRAAADHIEQYGHHKGAFFAPNISSGDLQSRATARATAPSCALGALAVECGVDLANYGMGPETPLMQAARRELAREVARATNGRFMDVPEFNDRTAATAEEVCALMRATADRIERHEAASARTTAQIRQTIEAMQRMQVTAEQWQTMLVATANAAAQTGRTEAEALAAEPLPATAEIAAQAAQQQAAEPSVQQPLATPEVDAVAALEAAGAILDALDAGDTALAEELAAQGVAA